MLRGKNKYTGNSVLIYHHSSTYEPARDKTNKMACAPGEDSDQPGHSPSLIRVNAQADQSLRCALNG